MTPVIQHDRTGCAFASVAALAGERYATVRKAAEEELSISVTDSKLWCDTEHMRQLLRHFRIAAGRQTNFTSWQLLPACALLAIKWHRERTGPAWHWVVFVRDESGSYVLDPKKALVTNRRTDFGRMKPKWFVPVRLRKRDTTGKVRTAHRAR
jgi:hypothetical protein